LLRQISTEAVLSAVIASVSSGKSEPRVYQLSNDTYDVILRIVESTRPSEAIQVSWFRLIGVSHAGIGVMLSIYELFRARAHENDIKRLVRTLRPLDFELYSLFFHLLKRHSDHRLIPLDATTAREQELTMRHRMGIASDSPIPAHLMQAVFCSIAACGELKNYIVQRTRAPLFCGVMHVAWDDDKQRVICTSKKTILGRARNEDRVRSSDKSGEPEYMKRLRAGDTSTFYGGYQLVSKLIRLPPRTSGAEDHPLHQPITPTPELFHDDEDDEEENEDTTTMEKTPSKPTTNNNKRARKRDGGRRENLERSFVSDITDKLRVYSDTLRTHGIDPTAHALYSLECVPKETLDKLSEREIETIEQARTELDAECKKEERRIFRLKTDRPCFEMPVTSTPICGYILEKDSSKTRNSSVAVTLCRSCGCTFDFSLRLNYANGYIFFIR